jgi:hypothetical protein
LRIRIFKYKLKNSKYKNTCKAADEINVQLNINIGKIENINAPKIE